MATFKPMKPTLRIIKQFKLDYFEDIYTIDKYEKPMTKTNMILDIIDKYKLIKDSTVMVGDALSDIDAANEAGISSIGACWGYCKDKQTLKEKATVVYNSIGELC
jgi:phosphoglycolate phosphatase-like HAD superfamily hydrolase